jgi:Rad3-related DNA helicase
MCNDKILVGPSLIEGLSFDDDLCRFQIIMKVPYPSLADKFVKAKKDINPAWYSNTTAISILQGVGRGIRNENDWCVTFIFDGCYSYLMRNAGNMFNNDFMKRIQVISPNSIVPKNN